jgi:hypothetical protein
MIRKLFYLLLVAGIAVVLWGAFAVWTGIYSVYSIPPSKEHPDGATLIVNREEGEPMFNSPGYTPPRKPAQQSGLVFTPIPKPKRALEERTIVKLPYIEWAFKKSLEPQKQSP